MVTATHPSKKTSLFADQDRNDGSNNDDSSTSTSSTSSSSSSSNSSSSSSSRSDDGKGKGKDEPYSTSKADKKTLMVEDDGDNGGSNLLTVNRKYAAEYQKRKQREELRQIEQERRQDGRSVLDDDVDDDDDGNVEDSSDEEEDEDGQLDTLEFNVQFLKTITALRKGDDSIYDPTKKFFDDDVIAPGNELSSKQSKTNSKPQRFKDIIRNQILEQMDNDNINESDGEEEGAKSTTNRHHHSSKFQYDEEQERLRKAFLDGTIDSDGKKTDGGGDDNSGGEDDWMIVKKRIEPETSSSEKEKQLLEREAERQLLELERLSKNKKSGHKTPSKTQMTVDFQDPRGEIENGEEFLIDFIKNKRWIDRTSLSEINDKNDAEMMDKDDDNGREPEAGDDSSLEDIDRADDFEAKYNFRYEEAEAAAASSGAHLSVRTYARGQTMNTVRRDDTARKDKRQARKERKAAERKAKEEQLKRLKNAKRQEMERKLSQVKAVLGNVDDDVIDEAAIMKMLEGDYDPENFEKAMKEAYGDEFYEKEDSEWKSDMDVRQSLEQDEDGEALVGADDENGGLYDNSNEGFDDDGPYDAENTTMEDEKYNEDEEWVNAEDDQHNQEETELERMLKAKIEDDLYKLDYEDIVAGMPTRFKYRQVEPNDYGLTTQEILFARDLTLKQFVSLKKMAPYNEQGEYHVGSRKRRKFREMLKQDLEELIPEAKDTHDETAVAILNTQKEHDTDDNTEPKKKKRRRLKKGKKKDAHEAQEGLEDNKEKEPPVEDKRENKSFDEKHNESKTSKPKKTKKKKNSNKHGNKVAGISGSRLASYGL